MAIDDMRINLNFVDHPKVKRLIRKAGYEAFYGLIRLFSIAGKMYQKGLFRGCTIEDIEDFADWHGEDGFLVDAMVSVGFMVHTSEGYAIHDWEHHQPWIYHADARSEQARKAIETRWERRRNRQIGAPDTVGIRGEYGANTNSNTPLPSPSPSPSPIPSPSPSPIPTPIGIGPTKSSPRFKKPSVEEVSAYCTERRNGVDPQTFIDFYDSKGWKVGKEGMKDWKAAVRTWEKRQKPTAVKTRYSSEGYGLDISKYQKLGGS